MKTLTPLLTRLATVSLAIGAASPFQAIAQPSSRLPSSYNYMEPPPPGYPSGSQPTSTRSSRPATKSAPPARTPSYGPLPDSLSLQVARLAANDHSQDSRISKLERDVSGIKSSPARHSSTNTGSDTPRAHTSYVVRPGDSLWRIASAHRVSPGEIMQLNRMKSDVVMLGHTLLIPAPGGSHTSSSTIQASYKPYHHDVRPGETSTSISKKYDISRQALMEANPRVDFGGGLIPGSRIVIPGKSTRVEPTKSAPPAKIESSGSYTVKSGDSLKAIAIKHGTTTANLAALNGIKDANKLIVGQRLRLPAGKSTSSSSNIAANTPKPVTVPKFNPAPASTDTTPLPGMGLAPVAPPTPPKSTPPPAAAPAASDIHRGVLAYRVDATDSIESIAHQFSTTPQRIREMNHLPATTKLASGDEIMVPAMGAVAVSR
jgi:LysM repeat protein